ncbi:cell division protein FtsL [uncultured Aquabacterium sp.]|uniref:cell division protein FtsL n=1 Tax=Aquabacterium sp. TaxID=1872578 RepID=UPI0025D00FA6|nr:cell division protein FtsL [uncultured Aquabacterium sp.]
MVRLNVVLAILLMASCVWLIRSSNEARRLFADLEKAKAQAHELQIDYERLQLDKRAQATPLRVEKLAREKLRMFNNTPALTHYVTASGAASASASAAEGTP